MKKIILTCATIFATLSMAFQTPEHKGYQPGDVVADFSLMNVDGKKVTLNHFKEAKGSIVIFTCNHCPFSKAYEDRIISLYNKYAPKGYPVIAINPNDPQREPEDSYENMQKRAKEKKFPFPYLFDATQQTAKTYGATRTPHVFLIKKSGKENVVHYIGAIDDNYEDESAVTEKYVEKAIAEIEMGMAVSKQTTKAIGCGIKWKK